ncbi:MAG: hypothetical protein ABL895_03655 [Cyclobacteriaceae bacterium]
MTDIFSTRELALIIWIIIAITAFSFDKNVRQSAATLLRNFFVTSIQVSILALVIYGVTIVYGLSTIGLWDKSLLKDTIIWGLTVAFILLINAHKIRDKNYFKDVVKDALKWTIVLEFIVSLYSFNFLTEIILVPIFVLLGAMQGYAMSDKKYERVEKLLSNLSSIIGLIIFSVVIFKTVDKFDGLFTIANLNSFIHPIIMTLLFIPFIYSYAVYMKYEEVFVFTDHFAKDKKKAKSIKKQIFLTARLNLRTLWTIRLGLYKIDFTQDNLDGVIKKMMR